MKSYQHLFFDLDHTLWDFERASSETLTELYNNYKLETRYTGLKVADFLSAFQEVNARLWQQYNQHQVSRDEIRDQRFKLIYQSLKLPEAEVPHDLGRHYLEQCPLKPHLLAGCHETLAYLQQKYQLHILTNGFKKVAWQKINSSGIGQYFATVVTSECSPYRKPQKGIFDYALSQAGALAQHSLMIGDSIEADVRGAEAAGIDAIYYAQNADVKHEHSRTVKSLAELREWL
jgi:putative hydrolase of the HAD superfamily